MYTTIAPDQHLADMPRNDGVGNNQPPTQAPGGPFVMAPGPVFLTAGLGVEGGAQKTSLNFADQVMLFGSQTSGAGTMQDSLIAQQIARQGSYILLDMVPDKERQDMLAYLHSQVGTLRKFHVLNVDDAANSHTYNPLARGTALEVARRVVHSLQTPTHAGLSLSDVDAAVSWLTVLIQALRERDGVAMFNRLHDALTDIDNFFRLVDATQLDVQTKYALNRQLANHQGGADTLMNFVRAPLAPLMLLLTWFAKGKLGQVLNVVQSEIDLLKILTTRNSLHVMLPTMGKDMVAIALGRLVMADLTDCLTEQVGRLPDLFQPPALIVIVETPVLSTGRLSEAFFAAKTARVTLVAGIADLSGLDYMSKADCDAMIQNCHTKVFFRAGSRETPEALRSFGELLTKAGAAAELPDLLEQSGAMLEGKGIIVRGHGLDLFDVWPCVEVQKGFDKFKVSQRFCSPK